jgi:hypothetical protein
MASGDAPDYGKRASGDAPDYGKRASGDAPDLRQDGVRRRA